MRVLFAGTPEPAIPSLSGLLAAGHEVAAVFAQPDRPSGRGRTVTRGAVAEYAQSQGLALHQPERINEAHAIISALKPDIAVIVAYGALIRPALLAIPRYGWLNLHFSLLPALRGAAPVQHALLQGDDITGATTFLLDEGMDTGPIVGQVTERIHQSDTTGTLMARLAESGAALVVASVAALSRGEIVPVAQPSDGVSFAPKITREQARIDWSRSGRLIERHVRAMSPHPGAFTQWRNAPLLIEAVSLTDSGPTLNVGEVAVQDGQVLCGTGDRPLCLESVRPAGKRSMSGAEWARGVREAIRFQ